MLTLFLKKVINLPVTLLPHQAIPRTQTIDDLGGSNEHLDLNDMCNANPSGSYYMQVEGQSMKDIGILNGSIILVDRTLKAQHGDVVVASVFGGFTVKELRLRPTLQLLPRNKAYNPIVITDDSCFEVFGVVTAVIHNLKK